MLQTRCTLQAYFRRAQANMELRNWSDSVAKPMQSGHVGSRVSDGFYVVQLESGVLFLRRKDSLTA